MSNQTSLMEHVAAMITFTQETSPGPDLNRRELTAVIVKLEPAIHGRCSQCNRWATLPFCLEYFNSQGDMIMWGEICEDCKEKSQGEI